jgi:hypothetical protein
MKKGEITNLVGQRYGRLLVTAYAGQRGTVVKPYRGEFAPCPACGVEMTELKLSLVARSRFVPLFVCSDCGSKETWEGFFWQAKFNATYKT